MSYIYNPRRVLGSTGHILRHVFETVIAEPLLGGSREKSRSVAALAPAYRYFADHDDLIVSIPDRELAIVAQFTDDPMLGYYRLKLSVMMHIDIVALDFSRPGGAIECDLNLGASWRNKHSYLNRLDLWIGGDGTVALVPNHFAYHSGNSSLSYLLGPPDIGAPRDAPFATAAERTSGIDRAIAAALTAPVRSAR